MDLSKATCATCPMFWTPGDGEGYCHAKPPSFAGAVMTQDQCCVDSDAGVWPSVNGDEWCGEHPIRRAAYELAVQAAKEATNG